MMKYWILMIAIPLLMAAKVLPDPRYTPGATNPEVTQENVKHNICPPHTAPDGHRWTTKDVRPSASYTNKLKEKQLESYYRGQGTPAGVEEDHLIPLTLGGCPTCEKNLWPQPRDGEHAAAEKDKCEVRTNKLMCEGKFSLKAAQSGIAHNWIQWCDKVNAAE
jgi:hypothetical protein